MAADGSIVIETNIDNKKAQQALNRLSKQIQSLEDQLTEKKRGRIPLEESLDSVSAKLEEARKQLSMLQDEQNAINAAMQPGTSADDFMRAHSDKDMVNAALKQQRAEVEAIEKEWSAANQKLKDYDIKISSLAGKLNQAKEEAGGIYQTMSESGPAADKMAKSVDRAQKGAGKFALRLREVIRSALVFTVITQTLAKFREWMGKVIKTNDEARAAMARLKGALLTLVQPLIDVIIPAFTKFVDILTRIVTIAARFMSVLFGTTTKGAADSAENLYDEMEALEGTGEAAEEARKSLAAFDEINQLSGGTKESQSLQQSNEIEPDFSVVRNTITDALTSIVELFTGVFLLAIGAILTFSGASIPVGLALMVLGAMSIVDAITQNPDAIKAVLRGGLGDALTIIGPLIAVIGVLLVVTGHILIGIALIIAGAALWTAGAASDGEGDFVQNILTRLSQAAQVIGPLIAVLGVFLVITGHILIGIALIIAGAALWAAGAAYGDEGDFIQNILTRLSEAAQVIGPLLAVIGVFLLVTGKIVLGLAFIVAGAAIWAVGTAYGDEGDFVQNILTRLQEAAVAIGPWIAIIGVILLCTGQILLGIGAIVAGISIFAISKMDTDGGQSLIENIVSALSAATVEISPYIAIIGLVLILVPGFQGIGIALLIAGIGLFIAGTAMAASNSTEMKSWVEVLQLDQVSQWVSTALLLAGIALVAIGAMTLNPLFLFAGIALLGGGVALKAMNGGNARTSGGSFSTGSGAGRMSAPKLAIADVPMLAKGAVIPPNREFLAVLGDQTSGTNYEVPDAKLRQLIREEIGNAGVGQGTTVVRFEGSLAQLARVLKPHIETETSRSGSPLVTGGAY